MLYIYIQYGVLMHPPTETRGTAKIFKIIPNAIFIDQFYNQIINRILLCCQNFTNYYKNLRKICGESLQTGNLYVICMFVFRCQCVYFNVSGVRMYVQPDITQMHTSNYPVTYYKYQLAVRMRYDMSVCQVNSEVTLDKDWFPPRR